MFSLENKDKSPRWTVSTNRTTYLIQGYQLSQEEDELSDKFEKAS